MYRKYFGLKKRPFILSPDPDFLYMSKIHDLALTHLEYGMVHNVGFIALTGDVGAGKTTLLKYLFEKIKDSLDVAMLFNTNLSPQAFLEMLVKEFEVSSPSRAKSDLVDVLSQHFLNQYSRGKRCVIMVDEAQNLPDETFEELRMLSNLEIGTDFLLQVVLVGQPQLKERLSNPSLAQLAQRISVYYHLSPLSKNEVGAYIQHRLRVAGCSSPEAIFEKDAIDHIAELSGGIPRIINSICDACLTYAYADEIRSVTKITVMKVARDNEFLLVSQRPPEKDDRQDRVAAKGAPEAARDKAPAQEPNRAINTDSVLAKLLGRIEALEIRVRAMESQEKDRTAQVLQEMLEKERDKNLHLEKKMTLLQAKYRAIEEKLKILPGQAETIVEEKKEKRFWDVFIKRKKIV